MRRASPHLPIAACAGGLVALSMPPWGWWPLAWIGIAVFGVALDRAPSRRWLALTALAFAFVWFVIATAWMWYLTAPGYVFSAALFAAFHAVAAVFPHDRWSVVSRPAAHTLAEALRIVFPFGGVPLATLAVSQAGGPLLAVARVGGVLLITWLVFQGGFALAAVFAPSRPEHGASIAVGVGALALAAVAAAVAPSGHDLGATVTVAAVQGGGEQGTSALDVPSRKVTERLLATTATIDAGAADVIVWPENGVNVDGEAFATSAAFAEIAAHARRLGVPILVGVTDDSEFSAHPTPGAFVNAHVVVTPEATVTSRYEKVHRVPFGEYVPLRSVLEALGAPLDQIPSDAVAGRDRAQLVLPDGTNVGVMISWEVFFGDRGRAANSHDAAWLINPTNGASYTGTILQTQQIASSRLRAVENGRWVVQVSPTGFSAFVGPDGTVFDRTGTRERAVIVRTIIERGGTTWYRTLGDWPWRLAPAAVLVAVLVLNGRANRRTRPSP